MNKLLWAVVAFQFICTAFFLWDISAGLVGLRSVPIPWRVREAIEIGAAIGLLMGLVIGTRTIILTTRSNKLMKEQLRAASGAFVELLEERFKEWNLTPAERDVAWFTLKGFSISEIADLRKTSEGTVKAQSFSIYRKSGVAGRTQLLSMFIEDMLEVRDGSEPPAISGDKTNTAAK